MGVATIVVTNMSTTLSVVLCRLRMYTGISTCFVAEHVAMMPDLGFRSIVTMLLNTCRLDLAADDVPLLAYACT